MVNHSWRYLVNYSWCNMVNHSWCYFVNYSWCNMVNHWWRHLVNYSGCNMVSHLWRYLVNYSWRNMVNHSWRHKFVSANDRHCVHFWVGHGRPPPISQSTNITIFSVAHEVTETGNGVTLSSAAELLCCEGSGVHFFSYALRSEDVWRSGGII